MRIGLIGAGSIGSTLAELAIEHGHDVVLSNSRGPETLAGLVSGLGGRASAATAAEAAAAGDLVVVTIPLKNYRQVPVAELAGKTVVDTNNYYPPRDGQIPELDSGATTSSELLAAHLPAARIVKAFNTLYFKDLGSRGGTAGTPDPRAAPSARDEAGARRVVTALIVELGFAVVDAGARAEGRRFEPGSPAYGAVLDAGGLSAARA